MRERKPIDQALRRFLDEQAAASGAPAEMTDEARTRMLRQRMVRALESRTSIPGLPNQVEMREVEIAPGLGARLYLPADAKAPLSTLVLTAVPANRVGASSGVNAASSRLGSLLAVAMLAACSSSAANG